MKLHWNEQQRIWPQWPLSKVSLLFPRNLARCFQHFQELRVWSSNQYSQVLQSRQLHKLNCLCICCHNALVMRIFLRPLKSTLLQMYLKSLCWDGGCSAVITCITEKSQKIVNWLGYKVWGKRYCLCMKTVWWVICITAPDHSELPVFILQNKVLCSLHQGDKTSHFTKQYPFVPLSATSPPSFLTTCYIFGPLNYLCEYRLL